MAAMALPIRELETLVRDEAKPKTVCIAEYSESTAENFRLVFKILMVAIALKLLFSRVARKQARVIDRLTKRDFSMWSYEAMSDLALAIDKLVTDERETLAYAHRLGYELRVFWPLRQLQEQVDHLDSIAESLHAETDMECRALMSIAAEQSVVV